MISFAHVKFIVPDHYMTRCPGTRWTTSSVTCDAILFVIFVNQLRLRVYATEYTRLSHSTGQPTHSPDPSVHPTGQPARPPARPANPSCHIFSVTVKFLI